MTETIDQYILVIVQFVVCTIGLMFNIFLVWVIIKNKILHTSCGCFLLALSLNDSVSELSLAFLPLVMTLGKLTMPLMYCFMLSSYGPYAQSNVPLIMLLISLDRFVSIALPIKYKMFNAMHKRKYACVVLAMICFVSLHQPYLQYKFVLTNPTKQVVCLPGDFIQGLTSTIRTYIIAISSTWIIVNYTLMWIILKFSQQNSADFQTVRRVFRSLCILSTLIVILWLPAPFLINYLIPMLDERNLARRVLAIIANQSNKIAQALNAPILFMCSSEYRKAMQDCLRKMLQMEQSTTQVHPVRVINAILNTHTFGSIS